MSRNYYQEIINDVEALMACKKLPNQMSFCLFHLKNDKNAINQCRMHIHRLTVESYTYDDSYDKIENPDEFIIRLTKRK